jgi:hypothetical protein
VIEYFIGFVWFEKDEAAIAIELPRPLSKLDILRRSREPSSCISSWYRSYSLRRHGLLTMGIRRMDLSCFRKNKE